MNDEIRFERITKDNLEIACKVQNEIFPEEDGRQNFVDMVEQNPYRKELDYYIVYLGEAPIGVTGIYSYHEYPDDAWMGWFGVLEKYRGRGLGGEILDRTIDLAREKGYKNFRLYTDEFAKDAHRLYESRGMVKEIYDRPDDRDEYFDAEVYIYSINLAGEKVEPWNNRFLGLKEQGEKENLYKNGLGDLT
ncbi:GNAT family N-acetyltransferase [Candidatus Saccharibacteria bacterium]|nr:GNAT family N-acetyltransferase [Candidatus Saccharibacteria bacterium]